jgi:hypothetical protein
MKNRSFQKILLLTALLGIGAFALFFLATCLYIGAQVDHRCQTAMRQYPGDCTEALIAQLNDAGQAYGERNSAIWALGQLGDGRALPVLQGYYTGNIPDREPWNGTISQYELKKAIRLTRGGVNLGAWVWRWMLN